MNDADITAFRPAPLPPRRRRLWPWALGAALLLALLSAGAVAALVAALGDLAGHGVHFQVNGEPLDFESLQVGNTLGSVLLALAATALVVLVVVPLAVAVALLGVTVGVAAALFAATLVLALASSPLLLIVGLVWLIVRPRRGVAAVA